jgi:hypothetical protein
VTRAIFLIDASNRSLPASIELLSASVAHVDHSPTTRMRNDFVFEGPP